MCISAVYFFSSADSATFTEPPAFSIFSFAEAEILSTKNIEDIQLKIITNICRNIQSQGLKGIVAFYKKTFNIDIESFNIQIEDKIYNFHVFI